MRRAISLIIFAGFLAAFTHAQQPQLSPDSGALLGKRYVNGYFGFSYRYPEGWKGNAVTRSAAAKAAPEKFYALFSGSPAADAGNDVRYISIEADEAPAGLRNPRAYMNASLRLLAGPGGGFQALHGARAEYAGHEFFRQDLRSKPAPGGPQFLQAQLVMVERGYAITLSFIAANKDDLEDLVRSAESLEFFAPGSLPQAPAGAAPISAAKAAAPAAMPAAGPAATQPAIPVAAASAPEPVTVVVTASAPSSSTESLSAETAPAAPELASARLDSARPAPAATMAESSENPRPAKPQAAIVAPVNDPEFNPGGSKASESEPGESKASAAKAGDQLAVIAAPLPQQIAVEPQAAQIISAAVTPAAQPAPSNSRELAHETFIRENSREDSRAESQSGESQSEAASIREPAPQAVASYAPAMAMSFAAPRVVAPPALSQPLYGGAGFRSVVVEAAPAPGNAAIAIPAAEEPQAPVAERPPASPVMVARVQLPAQQPPGPARLKISAVSFENYIVRKGRMVYPELARAARVQGDVVMRVVVNTAGQLAEIHAISGPILLRQGALESVKGWGFRPYLVNGAPVEVESEISVAFRLAQ